MQHRKGETARCTRLQGSQGDDVGVTLRKDPPVWRTIDQITQLGRHIEADLPL